MSALREQPLRILHAVLCAALGLAGLIAWLNVRGEDPPSASKPNAIAHEEIVERGAYLARAGNCVGCHTASGGADYAGGRGIETPFGIVYAPNITSDVRTGIGTWSADDFWRALHNGRSKNGRLLYPAFPYPSYTQVTREDSDALYAYLRSVPAVVRANREHGLAFPYSTQAALAVWRALYFKPGVYEPRPMKSAQWNRGGYLVRGLGHCEACHASHNALGATREDGALEGGPMPTSGWYAPPLVGERRHIVDVLKKGVSEHSAVMGPMAEVDFRSTQYLSDADLQAMAIYLADAPRDDARAARASMPDRASMLEGRKIYEDRCAACHGEHGQGAPEAYPPLAGNRTVTSTSPSRNCRP